MAQPPQARDPDTEPDRDTTSRIPGWLKLVGLGLIIVVLLIVAMMLVGGGGGHTPPGAH